MKVTVSKEVANAFEYLKEIRNYTSDNDLLTEHAEAIATKDWYDSLEPLNKLDLITFSKMLIEGYEVEQTPGEKVAELFKAKFGDGWGNYQDGVRYGIRKTLDTLNIKIPGVNDSV